MVQNNLFYPKSLIKEITGRDSPLSEHALSSPYLFKLLHIDFIRCLRENTFLQTPVLLTFLS